MIESAKDENNKKLFIQRLNDLNLVLLQYAVGDFLSK